MSKPIFAYQTPTGGSADVDYEGLYNQKIILRFNGFRLENGVLWQNRRLDDNFRFAEQDGQVIRIRDTEGKMLTVPVPVPQENTAQLYVNQVQLNLRVVKPLSHFDVSMSVRLKLKGIEITSAEGFSFTSDRTGLMRAIVELGLNWRLADRASEYHDPAYILSRMEESCVSPLTVEQIILNVIEPILQEAADDARLVEGQTGANNAWFQWDMSHGYLDAITDPIVLDQIWKEVEGHEPEGDESVNASEQVSDDTRTVASLGKTAEEVKAAIGDAVSGKVESALTGDFDIVPNPRVNEVHELILESEPGFKKGPGMLSRIEDSTLVAVYEAVFSEAAEEEAAL